MSHVPDEYVVSHMNESCPIWICRVTYEWVMSHMNTSCPICIRRTMSQWVKAHVVESSHTYKRVTSHVNVSRQVQTGHIIRHFTLNASCFIWTSCVMSRMNASRHIWIHHVIKALTFPSRCVCLCVSLLSLTSLAVSFQLSLSISPCVSLSLPPPPPPYPTHPPLNSFPSLLTWPWALNPIPQALNPKLWTIHPRNKRTSIRSVGYQ